MSLKSDLKQSKDEIYRWVEALKGLLSIHREELERRELSDGDYIESYKSLIEVGLNRADWLHRKLNTMVNALPKDRLVKSKELQDPKVGAIRQKTDPEPIKQCDKPHKPNKKTVKAMKEADKIVEKKAKEKKSGTKKVPLNKPLTLESKPRRGRPPKQSKGPRKTK